jgi:hypothetical protein
MAVDGSKLSTTTTMTTIDPSDVGGYTTLSFGQNDLSFAQNGATAGTNLRMIEGIWEISTGMQLADFEDASVAMAPQFVPRFVPFSDPNFEVGSGQVACIACHAGGLSSLNHGYQTVADVYDVNNGGGGAGFIYNNAAYRATTSVRKSLGSNGGQRGNVLACTDDTTTVCDPFSTGAVSSTAWDLSGNWSSNGTLAKLGWNAINSSNPTTGSGLNSLGVAIGQSMIVYQNLTQRVMREICPLNSISAAQANSIAVAAQSADDLRVIVASVASDPSCF